MADAKGGTHKYGSKYISKSKSGKFVLKQKGTGKILGHHSSPAGAQKQLAAIEINKKRAAGQRIPRPKKG